MQEKGDSGVYEEVEEEFGEVSIRKRDRVKIPVKEKTGKGKKERK